jgi:hypothetical protein
VTEPDTGPSGCEAMDKAESSRVVYPPLDVLKPVAPDIWVVDSGPLRALGLSIPIRMSVVKLQSGDVWLHSPTRYVQSLRQEIERIGRIGHLVAPSVAHWKFIEEWQQRCPNAVSWAAPGLSSRRPVTKSNVIFHAELQPQPPDLWKSDLDQLIIRGGLGISEVAFLHKPTRTLILTDLIENFEKEKLSPLLRPVVRLAGAMAPFGKAPVYYRMAVAMNRKEAAAAARRLIQWAPDRVIFAHGRWFESDATAQLQHSLRWLID